MAEFKFKSGKKTLNIEGKEYTIDVGNKEQLKKWTEKMRAIEELAKKMDSNNPDLIDDLERVEKEIIEATIGDWDRLYELAEGNIFAMLDLVRVLADEMKQSSAERFKGYGV